MAPSFSLRFEDSVAEKCLGYRYNRIQVIFLKETLDGMLLRSYLNQATDASALSQMNMLTLEHVSEGIIHLQLAILVHNLHGSHSELRMLRTSCRLGWVAHR